MILFLFGEAEKGEFCKPLPCKSLEQLVEKFGNAPEESKGLQFAVQALLYKRDLIYYRVQEEGFSTEEYLRGLQILRENKKIPPTSAICMPGVGDPHLIDETTAICNQRKSLLIIDEKDLYDYLTQLK